MKKRQIRSLRIGFGFNGPLQDDVEAYQGFMTVAEEQGWQVVTLYEQFERRVRTLLEQGGLDVVVGNLISAAWLEGLPGSPRAVHLGHSPLAGVLSVTPDVRDMGQRAARHLHERGYRHLIWFSPLRGEGMVTGLQEVSAGPVAVCHTEDMVRQALHAVPVDGSVGILGGSDFLARQAIRICREMGRTVPHPVGVMGLGDRFWDGVAAGMGITSIPIPHRRLGEQAARLLQAQLAGEAVSSIALPVSPVRARESTRKPEGGTALLERVREWMEESKAETPVIEELARRAGMSRRSFERAFAEQAGCTPYEYFLRLRTRSAMELLQTTDWSLARVGAEVGVPEPARFSAFIKKRTGKSPRTHRSEVHSEK